MYTLFMMMMLLDLIYLFKVSICGSNGSGSPMPGRYKSWFSLRLSRALSQINPPTARPIGSFFVCFACFVVKLFSARRTLSNPQPQPRPHYQRYAVGFCHARAILGCKIRVNWMAV